MASHKYVEVDGLGKKCVDRLSVVDGARLFPQGTFFVEYSFLQIKNLYLLI